MQQGCPAVSNAGLQISDLVMRRRRDKVVLKFKYFVLFVCVNEFI